MDGVMVAWRGVISSHKFLFWALVAWATHAIYWFREASREQLILSPAKPKDLYDNGYALFAYDISSDGWSGYWRKPDSSPGVIADEVFSITSDVMASGRVPYHEVEFSDMPHITFKVRAVELAWCRRELPIPLPMAA